MDLYRITVIALDQSTSTVEIDFPDLETARLVSFKHALPKTPTVRLEIVRGEVFEPVGVWTWRDGQSAAWLPADKLL